MVPENGVSVSVAEFNRQFPCVERQTDCPGTTTFVLPNNKQLIFLHAHA
jgi:hypothetical protein